MSKNIKLDDILDNCLERILIKDETIEQCLLDFPEYSDELKPLLEMAITAKQVTTIEPRTEFREQARYQFQVALRDAGGGKKWTLFNLRYQPRWITAIAIVIVVLLTTSGTIAAASGSMPNSPLYGIKLGTEQVRLTFTFSEIKKAELHTEIAEKRVNEIIYLAGKDNSGKITQVAHSLDSHLSELSFLVSVPIGMSRDDMLTEPAVAVQDAPAKQVAPDSKEAEVGEFSVREEPQEPVIKPAPAESLEAPVPPPSTINITKEQAKSTPKVNSSDNPRSELIIKITNQFDYDITRLRVILETAPESTRPALIRAISILEKGYKDAIESLNQP